MQVKGIKGYRDVHMTPTATPPAEEYEAWLNRPSNRTGRRNMHDPNAGISGTKLRRVVIMRKQGESWADCARAIGFSSGAGGHIKMYCEFMPEHLRP
jgi:hypothetical protein